MNQASWRLGHVPGLDGLRGVAILFVLVGHTQVARVHAAGMVGVTAFFTLSGFLITALLVQEQAQGGSIRLRAFYARRVRRLAPALLVFLLATGLMSHYSRSSILPDGRDLLGAAFYVGNYTSAVAGRETILLHTWSLCVEEQFYLLWPLVLVVFGRRSSMRGVLWAVPLLIVMCVLARLVVWDGGAGQLRVTYATEMRADALLVGCLTAIWVRSRRPASSWRRRALLAMAIVVCLALTQGSATYLLTPTVVPWMTAIVIVAVLRGGATWLTPQWLQLVGRRSYGLYLWHFPLFTLAASFRGVEALAGWVVALVLTAAIVHLSWRCIEEPFLRPRVVAVTGERIGPVPLDRNP